jgi:hypothetical protein
MKHLSIRHEQIVADPLRQERLLRALRIILEHQEDADASRTLCQSVNTHAATGGHHCQPGRSLKHYIHQQDWSLLPNHAYRDQGISGARLDRPALDRLRDAAQRGECDAVMVLSPDRLARNYAHQWLLIEAFATLRTQVIFLQNPFGDTPQGKLLTQMQGMIAESERAQILERTRRGRLEAESHGPVHWHLHRTPQYGRAC